MGIEGGDGGTGGAGSPISKESKSESGTLCTIPFTGLIDFREAFTQKIWFIIWFITWNILLSLGSAHNNSLPDCLMTSPASSILSSLSTTYPGAGRTEDKWKNGTYGKKR